MTSAFGSGPFERMLRWLRAGYPEGIPQHDYVALFGILNRTLTDVEVEQIATALHAGDGALAPEVPAERIREIIRSALHLNPSDDDVRRVAGRLALGGWPLVAPDALEADAPAAPGPEPEPEPVLPPVAEPPALASDLGPLRPPTRIERMLGWLKAGYPHGIPEADFVPLLGLLQRRLSAEEMRALGERLRATGLVPANRVDVGVEYLRITRELPDEAELRRIVDHLRETGVELVDDPEPDGPV